MNNIDIVSNFRQACAERGFDVIIETRRGDATVHVLRHRAVPVQIERRNSSSMTTRERV